MISTNNNNRIRLKVCGLMNEDDVKLCIELGVKRIGFVTEFPISVPWNIDREKASKLRCLLPMGYQPVVVTGGSEEKILEIARLVKPSYMQLHFNEGPDSMKALVKKLNEDGIGVIGKFPTKEADMLKQFGTTEIEEIVKLIIDSGVDEILIDPRSADNAASKSLSSDAGFVKKVKAISSIPVIIAGGIDEINIKSKLQESGADSADVMNGSEYEPGRKSREKIEKLVKVTQAG